MRQVLNDVEAGKVTEELRRRGIPPRQRLRVVVESIEAVEPSVTPMNAAGGAFDWLAEEPISIATRTLSSVFVHDENQASQRIDDRPIHHKGAKDTKMHKGLRFLRALGALCGEF